MSHETSQEAKLGIKVVLFIHVSKKKGMAPNIYPVVFITLY